ncbi:MAG: DUF3298 and DUF4163 domain-containing protein [Cytophagaceae bacterium]|nr:DUF3298 and DUF4163 domain-containing protein [Cytophagaceae bacterium]
MFFHKLLPLSLFVLAACESRQPATQTTATATPDTLAYAMRTYEARSKACAQPDSLCAVASFEYPEFTGDAFRALNDSLRADVITMAEPEGEEALRAKTLEDAAQNFTADYDRYVSEASDSLPVAETWRLEIRTQVLRQTPRLVCLAHAWYLNSGGAHPNSATRFVNHDRATGRRLTLDALFKPGYEKTLNALAEKHFRQVEKLKFDESLKGKYFFENDRFALNDNFTLTPTSLKFLYNPYEIKSYAQGITVVEIPLSELEGLINEQRTINNGIH